MLHHLVEYNSSLKPQERLIAAFISRLNMNWGGPLGSVFAEPLHQFEQVPMPGDGWAT